MLLKDYAPAWPPNTTIADGKIPPKPNLDDIVSAVKAGALQGQLSLIMNRQYGIEYVLPIVVPQSLQQKLVFEIVRRKKMTLREVGELSIS
jgi:hypothetical protein